MNQLFKSNEAPPQGSNLYSMSKQQSLDTLTEELGKLKTDEEAMQEVLDQAADYNLPFAPGDTIADARYAIRYHIVRVLINEENPDKSEYIYLRESGGTAQDWSQANGRTLMKKCNIEYRSRPRRQSPGRTSQFAAVEEKTDQMTQTPQ